MNYNIQALDALLNISEEAKQSIYTYGMASVSNLISESLSEKINCLDSNNNYYYDNSNGEMGLLAYRNILYIEYNFTKGDLAI